MIRRRRLIITPGPGRQLPDPEDPSLPQVSPQQPEPEPPLPAPPRPGPPPGDDEPRETRSAVRACDPWLRSLGVEPDEKRHAWLEPHLWAALRARLDASAAERRSRWIQPRLH
jgi:hypothetical protein